MLSICCNHFVNVSISFGKDAPHLHGKKREVMSVCQITDGNLQIFRYSEFVGKPKKQKPKPSKMRRTEVEEISEMDTLEEDEDEDGGDSEMETEDMDVDAKLKVVEVFTVS
jgi:hypothetical protein